MLLRRMLKFKRLACGSEDVTQNNTSFHSNYRISAVFSDKHNVLRIFHWGWTTETWCNQSEGGTRQRWTIFSVTELHLESKLRCISCKLMNRFSKFAREIRLRSSHSITKMMFSQTPFAVTSNFFEWTTSKEIVFLLVICFILISCCYFFYFFNIQWFLNFFICMFVLLLFAVLTLTIVLKYNVLDLNPVQNIFLQNSNFFTRNFPASPIW